MTKDNLFFCDLFRESSFGVNTFSSYKVKYKKEYDKRGKEVNGKGPDMQTLSVGLMLSFN